MRILSFYPTKTFKLIMEFENNTYKIIDIGKFLEDEQDLLKDLCNDINLFMSAELDNKAGTIKFSNEVELDNTLLYEASCDLDRLMKCNRNYPKPLKITRLSGDYQSKMSKENEKLLKLLKR